MVNKAGKNIGRALWALLASQVATWALAEETKTLAEPFRTDISEILSGQTGQVIHIDSISELANAYKSGSSVVVEWNYGISESALQNLQTYINEHYSHLNVLVYLAEQGGISSSEMDVCDSNDKLKKLKREYYNNAISGGEGRHVILYLAGTSLDDPERMLCALISPQMAELTGPDNRIFVPGQSLFDSVVSELRPDFNRIWAIRAFLEGMNNRVEMAEAQQEREQLAYVNSITSISTQLESLQTRIIWVSQREWVDIWNSELYQSFQEVSGQIQALVSGDPRYVNLQDRETAQNLLNQADHTHNQIVSAATSMDQYTQRVDELWEFEKSFHSHEYRDQLWGEFSLFQIALEDVRSKLEAGDIDYINFVSHMEETHKDLQSAISWIDTQKNIKKGVAGLTWAGILWSLRYLNRRRRRLDSKEDLENELKEFLLALQETKRIFDKEIQGNTQAIEMFFGNQKWETKAKIVELKESVAYISVLIPKIEEILQTVKDSIWISAVLKATPFENALAMLRTQNHEIDPNASDIDKKLLRKINGNEDIQDLSTLIESMNKTFPELIDLLDQNIKKTKTIFASLKEAAENLDWEIGVNINLANDLQASVEQLRDMIHPDFWVYIDESIANLTSHIGSHRTRIESVSHDVLWAYTQINGLNEFIEFAMQKIISLQAYISEKNPIETRKSLELAWYDMSSMFQKLGGLYAALLWEFSDLTKNPEFDIRGISNTWDAIMEHYNLLEKLASTEERRSLIDEQWKWIISHRTQLGDEIEKSLWDALETESLFIEEGYDTDQMYADACEYIWDVSKLIQAGNYLDGREAIAKASELHMNMEKIIKRTHWVGEWYHQNKKSLETTRGTIAWSLERVQKKIDELKNTFDASVLILREEDFKAQDSDIDLGNNADEITEFLSQGASDMQKAIWLVSQGKLLEASTYLDRVLQTYMQAFERIKEVDSSHELITTTHAKNPESYKNLVIRVAALKNEAERSHITPKTQWALWILEISLGRVNEILLADKQNPYEIEDMLEEISDGINSVAGVVRRDEAEYREYIEYTRTATNTWRQYKQLLSQVSRDEHPDSDAVERFFSNAPSLESELWELIQHAHTSNQDWYALNKSLEKVITRCEYNTQFIHIESRERKSAFSDITSASRAVRKAKNWSGRYVSISSIVWDSELRQAHRAYENGDFSAAERYANSAISTAKRAISNAENEDRAEKRRRAAAKAAREAARRAAARRSSSSSSSSISFGGWGWGGSGFSGGRF